MKRRRQSAESLPSITCPRCAGVRFEVYPAVNGHNSYARPCRTCNGSGRCAPPPPEQNRTGDSSNV